jgi:hypothetical protein
MLTLDAIHERIEACSDRLDSLYGELRKAAREAAEAEAAFKVSFAKARLTCREEADRDKIKVTVDLVEDVATEATANERFAHLLASNKLLTLREALRATQSQMDGYRTEAASHRIAGG